MYLCKPFSLLRMTKPLGCSGVCLFGKKQEKPVLTPVYVVGLQPHWDKLR